MASHGLTFMVLLAYSFLLEKLLHFFLGETHETLDFANKTDANCSILMYYPFLAFVKYKNNG